MHPSLVAALACPNKPAQAAMFLPFGAAVPAGLGDQRPARDDRPEGVTTIQYLCTQSAPDPASRHVLRTGRLSVTWRPAEGHDLIGEQVAQVWEAMESATEAVTLVYPRNGGTVTDVRVGAAAHARLVSGAAVARSGSERLLLA